MLILKMVKVKNGSENNVSSHLSLPVENSSNF